MLAGRRGLTPAAARRGCRGCHAPPRILPADVEPSRSPNAPPSSPSSSRMVALISVAAVVPDAAACRPGARCRRAAPASSRRPGMSATAHTTTARTGRHHDHARGPASPRRRPPAPPPAGPAATLPHGATSIFGDGRFLVAYYGTAETGALGVLGETPPDADAAAGTPRGRAVRPPAPARPGRLRADRHHRRPPRRQGRRLLPRHPAPRGAEVHRRRAPARRAAAARHPAGPVGLPDRRQALGVGAQGPLRRPRARPRVADGQARRAGHPDRLGRRLRGQPGLGLAARPDRPATRCRRSCSCCTSSAPT